MVSEMTLSSSSYGHLRCLGWILGGVLIEVQAVPISVPGNSEPVNAATVDLTDFGLDVGTLVDTVTLWATAGSADIAGIAAINVGEPIPSPSTALLSAFLALGVLGRRGNNEYWQSI